MELLERQARQLEVDTCRDNRDVADRYAPASDRAERKIQGSQRSVGRLVMN